MLVLRHFRIPASNPVPRNHRTIMASIATLERIPAAKLRDLLLAEKADDPKVAVVDVRDDDYIGGHIKGALNVPSQQLDARMPTLVRQLQDKPTVIFHCALSQQRGPGAALRYIRERDEALKKAKVKDADASSESAASPSVEQKVYVLDRGFVGWQEAYGEDENLTEGYRKELWKDGYSG
ncbi:hypothetical protein MCOR25_004137 [Pyricularia grisea]|uniref:Rhodanese domain-containing protein n=1 Tax=Pyricularia grisea TaxID=148305 RepID=A0A6P8AP88_PYRGI|nr:hypothetical protein PgNI_11258 [Pyricularia grisea]KAI6370594.1 hypothetical protein MCOR25_004137 [Pyricularia grisea]TLD03833.1 hypothetical protein PgNI_11258 [Pyricularia grisea]